MLNKIKMSKFYYPKFQVKNNDLKLFPNTTYYNLFKNYL